MLSLDTAFEFIDSLFGFLPADVEDLAIQLNGLFLFLAHQEITDMEHGGGPLDGAFAPGAVHEPTYAAIEQDVDKGRAHQGHKKQCK